MSAYPPIGSVVVSKNGCDLVLVWPNESSSDRCFTGVNLFTGDCSCLWLRSAFDTENLFKQALIRKYRSQRKAHREIENKND